MLNKNQHLEFTPQSLTINTKRFLRPNQKSTIHWNKITTIEYFIWDCFSYHVSGYRLILSPNQHLCITDTHSQWQQLKTQLQKAFPTIDQNQINKADALFPSECNLTVWQKKHPHQQTTNI